MTIELRTYERNKLFSRKIKAIKRLLTGDRYEKNDSNPVCNGSVKVVGSNTIEVTSYSRLNQRQVTIYEREEINSLCALVDTSRLLPKGGRLVWTPDDSRNK